MAEVSVIMTPQEAALWRAQQKIIRQTQEMEKGYTKAGKAGQGAAKQTETATKRQEVAANQLTRSLTRVAAGYMGWDAAIRVAAGAFQFMRQEADAAMASATRLTDARRRLVQVTTSEADLKNLERLADEMSAKYGVGRETTRQILFSARSEGFEDFARELIASSRVIAPEAAATAAGQIPGLFPGRGLTPAQSVNAALVAAQQSRLDFEQLVRSLPGAAEGAGMAGAGPAETMALASVLASRFKSGETAADRIKAFGTRVALDPALAGRGVLQAVRDLQAASEERRQEFLGTSQELNTAFVTIGQELSVIEQRQRQIQDAIGAAGTARSALAEGRRRAGVVFAPQQAAEAGAIAREAAREGALAGAGFLRQAAVDQAMVDLQQAGVVSQWAAQGAGTLAAGLRVSPEAVGQTARTTGTVAGWSTPQLLLNLAEVVLSLRQAALEQLGASREMRRGSSTQSAAQRAQAAVPAE